jgi:flagellar biosynthesis protein FlhF
MSFRKTFFADTIEGAMLFARKELGDDALLLESRAARQEERHRGAYALEFESAASTSVAGPPTGGTPAIKAGAASADGLELSSLRDEIANISQMVVRLATRTSSLHRSPEISSAAGRLLASGFPEAVTHKVLDAVERRLGPSGRAGSISEVAVQRALTVELDSRLSVSPELGTSSQTRKVVALVGPAGAGKTSVLVKLAMTFGVTRRLPTVIVSADSQRIAATEQLRTYAAILGLPFSPVTGRGALTRTLGENQQKQLVLIDCPGFGGADDDLADECAGLLGECPEVETHLVLNATTKFGDLELAIRRWSRFQVRKLVLTHLDETESYGECLAAAMNSELPIAFLSAGQRIPEDLELATKGRLLEMLLGTQAASFAAVA